MKNDKLSIQDIGLVVTTILAVAGILIGLKVSISNTIVFSLLTLIILVQVVWFYVWYKNTDNMFKKDYTKNRQRAYNLIKQTKLNLYSTHFARSVPPADYTAKIIEKLESGVDVYRVIDRKMMRNSDIKVWLKQFKKFRNYHETITNKDLPFDISVFDGKKAILYFPGHPEADDFDMSIYIENEQLAHIFMMLFSKIKNSSNDNSTTAFNLPKSSGVWLKDAYHVPYLVIEGVIDNESNINLDEKLTKRYRKIDLNNIGKVYALDDNNRAIFCIDHNRCALCYYINGEANDNANYADILTEVRTNLDTNVMSLEEFLIDNNVKLNFRKLYLQDPARHIG